MFRYCCLLWIQLQISRKAFLLTETSQIYFDGFLFSILSGNYRNIRWNLRGCAADKYCCNKHKCRRSVFLLFVWSLHRHRLTLLQSQMFFSISSIDWKWCSSSIGCSAWFFLRDASNPLGLFTIFGRVSRFNRAVRVSCLRFFPSHDRFFHLPAAGSEDNRRLKTSMSITADASKAATRCND